MRYIYKQATGENIFEFFNAEEIVYFLKLINWKREKFLDYSLSEVTKHYESTWIEKPTRHGVISAPYLLLYDYRGTAGLHNWGTAKIIGDYQFPSKLITHRSKMTELYEKRGLLNKGNSFCPRVFLFKTKKGQPYFELQRATYYDQVGTNLSLDYKFKKPFLVNNMNCLTVREWDVAQSKVSKGTLPEFNQSLLANTIGVSIGISAKTKNGQKVILKRRRSKRVAVYAGMWSTPFGFALELEEDIIKGKQLSIEEIIRRDYNHEFAQELGLEYLDFSAPKPLAFCRDLLRGGKPQFFLESKALIPYEDLRKKIIDKTGEHDSRVRIVSDSDTSIRTRKYISPEFLCLLILMNK